LIYCFFKKNQVFLKNNFPYKKSINPGNRTGLVLSKIINIDRFSSINKSVLFSVYLRKRRGRRRHLYRDVPSLRVHHHRRGTMCNERGSDLDRPLQPFVRPDPRGCTHTCSHVPRRCIGERTPYPSRNGNVCLAVAFRSGRRLRSSPVRSVAVQFWTCKSTQTVRPKTDPACPFPATSVYLCLPTVRRQGHWTFPFPPFSESQKQVESALPAGTIATPESCTQLQAALPWHAPVVARRARHATCVTWDP
jgi:hypothetical protein